jgi:hypothetical protein
MSSDQKHNFRLPILGERPQPRLDVYAADGSIDGKGRSSLHGRPSIGVYFACSGQYVRVYRSVTGDRYSARCPKCSKTIGFRVGEGGTHERMFTVSCT